MSELTLKPKPPDSDLSRPYWNAASNGQLMIQKCGCCSALRHYPRLICDQCYSGETVWVVASGRGKIHSWTVAHHAFHPAFKDELPYAIVTVDLEEGPRALGRWLGGNLTVEQPVLGHFNSRYDTPVLFFEPVMRVEN